MTEPNGVDLTIKMKQLEFLGHEILSCKQHLLELDQNRQAYRQAWRAAKTANADPEGQKKTWFVVSPKMFIQYPTSHVEERLKEKVDETEKESDDVQVKLKKDINQLRKYEGKDDLTELGFDLKPVITRFLLDDE